MKRKLLTTCIKPPARTRFHVAILGLTPIVTSAVWALGIFPSVGNTIEHYVFTGIIAIIGAINSWSLLVAYPDVVLYEDGLEVDFLWKEVFIAWEKLVGIRIGSHGSFVHIKGLPMLNYLIDFPRYRTPAIVMGKNYLNYDQAIMIIKEKLAANSPREIV